MPHATKITFALAASLAVLSACSSGRFVENREYGTDNQREEILRQTGADPTASGIMVFGVDRSQRGEAGGGSTGMTVNAFLWRATLDTLNFMPLSSADPFGGVVITDWYTPQAAEGERFKATAYITSRQLRSDGIRVQVFRQVNQRGTWVDAPTSSATNSELEDRVLARARELRSQSAGVR